MARILIIDDSPTAAKVVSVVLRADGHTTVELAQFSALGTTLDTFIPDVIVLDLSMPGFNGVQFARFIRRFCEVVPPIILHSGSDRDAVREAAREIKPFGTVTKGASPREISRVVARALMSGERAEPLESAV